MAPHQKRIPPQKKSPKQVCRRRIINAILYLVRTGGACGYDAGKKVKGRKRHIIVDTLGLIMSLVIHTADIQDQDWSLGG